MSRDPWVFQRWAFDVRTGNPARKAILVALAVMAETNTGRCEALQGTLSQQVEVDPQTISRHLKALERAGFIARRQQHRVDGGRRGDEFLLLAPWVTAWPDGELVKDIPPPQSDGGGEGQSNGGPPTRSDGGVPSDSGGLVERPPLNDRLGTRRASPSSSEPLGFVEWLDHHCELTGQRVPGVGTRARSALARKFGMLVGEGRSLDELKLASIGAHSDSWLRENGKTFPRNVLVFDRVDELIEKGRKAQEHAAGGPQGKMVRTKATHPWDEEM
jgi:Helix-turn-helix domain